MDNSKKTAAFNAMNMMVNHLSSTIRGQISSSQHYTSGTKHAQAWTDYGYPEFLTFEHHYQMYLRFGPAKAGINLPIDTCWKTPPTILEGDDETEAENRSDRTEWESLVDQTVKKFKVWKKAKAVDRRQSVYQYGALIVQIKSTDKEKIEWDKPLKNISLDEIVDFIPAYQKQLEPGLYDDDETSIRYGLPINYNFNENNIIDNREEQNRLRSATIHHSRVIILAEGADDGSIYGTPALEGGYNHLLDMIKIAGGGAEGVWQNSKLKTVLGNTDKDSAMPSEEEMEAIDEAMKDFVENFDDYILTGGLEPKLLQSTMPNPKEYFNASLGMFSASLAVPVPQNMLMGSQTGVLASDKDGSFFLSSCQSRRENWCSQVVETIVDWLIDHGAIQKRDFIVQWDDLMAMSDEQKVDIAAKMAKVNKESAAVGQVFTVAEMRMVAGYKSEAKEDLIDESELTEEDDDLEDDNEN
jgi:hypothetical protein